SPSASTIVPASSCLLLYESLSVFFAYAPSAGGIAARCFAPSDTAAPLCTRPAASGARPLARAAAGNRSSGVTEARGFRSGASDEARTKGADARRLEERRRTGSSAHHPRRAAR